MSLLLDALKKNSSSTPPGDKTGKFNAPNLSEMSLEELPSTSASAPSASASSAAPSHSTPVQPSPRSTGENLFAAKKSPSRKKFQYKLGIIPTAVIIGSILGIAGGVYVWIEIQPPKVAQFRAPAAVASNYSAPAPRAAPPLALPPERNQPPEKQAKVQQAFSTESHARSANVKRAPARQAEGGIQVQRKFENDGIYTTLTAAYQAYQSGDYGTAWQRYREVLQKDSRNRDAMLGMAAIAQQQGKDEAAIQYYRQVLTLDPRDPVALAGLSAFSTGDAAGKESRLKSSLAQSPQSAALYFALGRLYSEQSRWGDAEQAFSSGLKIEPANALCAFSLATSLDHLGRSKLAAQYYQQALQLDTSGNSGFDRVQTEQRMKQLQKK